MSPLKTTECETGESVREIDMEISLFDAAIKGFLNLLHLKVLFAMLIGVSIGTFTAVAPQGLGMPLVYAIALPIRHRVGKPSAGSRLLIGASSVSAICAGLSARSCLASREAPAPKPPCWTAIPWANAAKGDAL